MKKIIQIILMKSQESIGLTVMKFDEISIEQFAMVSNWQLKVCNSGRKYFENYSKLRFSILKIWTENETGNLFYSLSLEELLNTCFNSHPSLFSLSSSCSDSQYNLLLLHPLSSALWWDSQPVIKGQKLDVRSSCWTKLEHYKEFEALKEIFLQKNLQNIQAWIYWWKKNCC